MTILDLLSQDGIEPRRVAHTSGGEYAGPCPVCGGVDRFRVWPEEGTGGKYWCRGCEKGGDCIQYLRDFRNLSYREACDFLGQEPKPGQRSFDQNKQTKERSSWEPREITSPLAIWVEKCGAFIDWCQNQLLGSTGKSTLQWLQDERGLSLKTIKAFRLGFNPQDAWRDRKAWGLPDEFKEDGKLKKVWLPSGVTIPYFVDGVLQRARIRRQDPEQGPPYCIVSGSNTGPMILGNNRRVYVIVESELDAILLSQEIGDLSGVIALGNAQTRPDKQTASILYQADSILIALDNDDPGAKESWQWWPNHFPQVKRLPPVYGKDPGEMIKAGVNLREWIEAGIELNGQEEEIIDQNQEPGPPKEDPFFPADDSGVIVHQADHVADDGQGSDQTGNDEQIEALEDKIMAALAGRAVPIQLSRAETITDVGRFARGAARSYFSSCKWVQRTAADHLRALGIEAESIKGVNNLLEHTGAKELTKNSVWEMEG